MSRIFRRKVTLAGAGVAAAGGLLAFALVGPGAALADPTPTPSGTASAPAGQSDRDARRAQQQNELAEKLAKELGVDQSKVQAALDKIRAEQQAASKAERLAALKERLDKAVAEGKLTQAEADAIYKAAENGVFPEGRGPGRGRGR